MMAGRFREDLFYRLAVAVIQLPPLRERDGNKARVARLLGFGNATTLTNWLERRGVEP